jgi:hypothetical protein
MFCKFEINVRTRLINNRKFDKTEEMVFNYTISIILIIIQIALFILFVLNRVQIYIWYQRKKKEYYLKTESISLDTNTMSNEQDDDVDDEPYSESTNLNSVMNPKILRKERNSLIR